MTDTYTAESDMHDQQLDGESDNEYVSDQLCIKGDDLEEMDAINQSNE